MVAVGQNPSTSVSRAPNQPPPVPLYKDKWVKRTYTATKVATAAGATNFVVNDFGLPADTVVYVDKMQFWNLSASAKGLKATFFNSNATDLGNDSVVAEDWSSLGQCPGVTFKVPLGHAVGVSNGTALGSAESLPSGTGTFTYVSHLHCWVAV